jgi:phage-related protein
MSDVGAVKYKVELDDSGLDNEVSKTESKLSSKFGSAAKGIAAGVGKAAIGAVAAGTTAVIGLVKTASDAYGDFQQLSGGIETLFGDSADAVMQNAEKAFKTAGMSMNDYMETSIQSAAALINSLDGDQAEAARLMDMSITDMADNVNKMGTDMEAVQNAYRGFSRGNFSMLDNLALGFSGTKEGMQELLDQAQQISGVEYDISSYSDIVEAIHVVQEEMGITGTTAQEASDTLQGSLSQMQAAWTNLTAGLANPDADIGQLIGDMVDSAKTFLGNLIPVISQAFEGIALAVAELAPVMAEELPGLFEKTLPVLLEAGVECIKALAEGIIKSIPTLMPTITKLVLDLVKMLIEMLPDIIEAGLQVILALAMGIAEALPDLIPTIVDVVLTIVEALIDNVDLLIDASIALIIGLAEGLINALPKLIEKAPVIVEKLIQAVIRNAPKIGLAAIQLILELVKGIMTNLPKIVEAGWNIISSVIKGIGDTLTMLPEYGKQVINKIWDGIKSLDPVQWGKDMIQSFIDGIMGMISSVGDAVGRVADTVKSFLGFSEPEKGPLSNFHTFPKDMVDLYAQGIEDNAYKVADAAEGLAGDIAMGFNSDINYNVPDLAGYAADLSASITGTGQTRIEVPVVIDGREVARASAWYMGEQLAWEAR